METERRKVKYKKEVKVVSRGRCKGGIKKSQGKKNKATLGGVEKQQNTEERIDNIKGEVYYMAIALQVETHFKRLQIAPTPPPKKVANSTQFPECVHECVSYKHSRQRCTLSVSDVQLSA